MSKGNNRVTEQQSPYSGGVSSLSRRVLIALVAAFTLMSVLLVVGSLKLHRVGS